MRAGKVSHVETRVLLQPISELNIFVPHCTLSVTSTPHAYVPFSSRHLGILLQRLQDLQKYSSKTR